MEPRTSSRSADFQFAVSRIFNPQTVAVYLPLSNLSHPAECNSAIRQIKNLRYESL
jgi:hypothetical protein